MFTFDFGVGIDFGLDIGIVGTCILFFCFILSLLISYSDIKTKTFSFFHWMIFTALGIGWCFDQSFIPISLLPVSFVMAIMKLFNIFKKKVIGDGDILLFLTISLFIPFDLLSLFLILCGFFGFVTSVIVKKISVKEDSSNLQLPFAPAILLSFWMSFIVYCISY